MDQAGIDMQIVSYSNATQDAPLAQGVSLAHAANDRLAATPKASAAVWWLLHTPMARY